MKKLVTIILLILLGYNSIGYYIIYHFQQLLAQREITESIIRGEYLEQDLKLFKLPVKEYFQQSNSDFNRVEGDFEYHGKFYERVKEKLENDTMYIYCLNDEKQEMLFKQLAEHIEDNLLNDKDNQSNKSNKVFKNLIKDYLSKSPIIFASDIHLITVNEFTRSHNLLFASLPQSIPSPPPKVC